MLLWNSRYAYYSRDPFVLASNIPGILVSFWLNSGASKLQYYMEVESQNSFNNDSENRSPKRNTVFTPQDKLMLGILTLWITILVCVSWLGIGKGHEKEIIGILANVNVLFFYAAPLQVIRTVVADRCSDSIHTPTMMLNCSNAGFWSVYGLAINNPVIYGPNGIGFFLGLSQAALCCLYPKNCNEETSVDVTPLLTSGEDEQTSDDEEDEPAVSSHQVL